MFVPKMRGNGQTILAAIKMKASLPWVCGCPTTWKVYPHWIFQVSLNESIAEINAAGCPTKCHQQDQEEADQTPSNNWSVSLEVALLKITSTTIAGFILMDFSIRSALAMEDPCAGNDLCLSIYDWDFIPSTMRL
jgi:hypothetical protein